MAQEIGSAVVARLEWGDYLAVALYFISVISVGLWAAKISRSKNVSGYFLASRNMHWIPVGASLFASNIGSEHFIGLAGSGAATGLAVGVYELNAIFVLQLMGWIFVPVYLASGVYTMPEYLRKRFGGQRIRMFLSFLSLLLYIFTKISADLFSGALFIKYALLDQFELDGDGGLYLSILILLGLAALFTIGGGLTAVIWTDFIQTILMVIGAIVLSGLGIRAAGGYEAMLDKYSQSEPESNFAAFEVDSLTGANVSCSKVDQNFMHLVRPTTDGTMPWTGYFSGILIGSIWYWCADQVIVQRTLAAKNISHAKAGCVLAGFLKVLPLFTLVIPGMAARVLFTNEVACSQPEKCKQICFSEEGCTNVAYIKLVLEVMPHGMRGLMFAVMLAALMSSLTSIFNSASTIFTMDIWVRMRRNRATQRELLLVGRVCVIFLVGISVAWIPVISQHHTSQLFLYVQSVSNYFAPPVAAVYVLAILWPRINEPAAFWSLIGGFVVGIIRMGLDFGMKPPRCGSGVEDTRPQLVIDLVDKFHFLHFGGFLFALTCLMAYVIAILTNPIPGEKLHRLTYWSRKSTEIRAEDNLDHLPATENQSDGIEGHTTEDRGIMKVLYFLCCLSSKKVTAQPKSSHTTEDPSIYTEGKATNILQESEKTRLWLNVGSVTAMCLAMFIWGFYA